MSNEEDDKPTVVLDISALKEELAQKKNVNEAIDQEIEFAVHDDTDSTDLDANELSLEDDLDEDDLIIFFDYSSTYFSKLVPKLPSEGYDFKVIKELKELNTYLQSGDSVKILFNYSAAPKAVNQLTTQIKSKFPNAKTIIVGKGLTADKAAVHQKSKAGADAYLNIPFSVKKFKSTVDSI
jgi:molybdopterin converting factor small subunit